MALTRELPNPPAVAFLKHILLVSHFLLAPIQRLVVA
jgi:hypothetical protein